MKGLVRKRMGIALTCATILLSSFIVSIVYSAQNVSFGLVQNVKTEWKDGNVTLSIPFYVRNHGVYDIEDVNIALELRDSARQILTKTVNRIGTIRAGSELEDFINITFQPVSLLLQIFLSRIFQNRTLELHATASLNYALSWITLEAEASIPLTPQLMMREMLESLVKDVSFSSNPMKAQVADEGVKFALPFSINHTDRFGIENFELDLWAKSSAGDVLGLFEITFQRLSQGENMGLLNVTLDKELATNGFASVNTLTIRLRGEINGFSFEWTRDIAYNDVER
jgi:hypothetical protein